MISHPNAKINLGLNIINKRPDGYHNIESIFYPIPLTDTLEINEHRMFEFQSSGLTIDGKTDDNLVVKAYRILKEEFEIPNVKIHLTKVIPFGGGLGGGSSDAAFCLKMLNEIFQLKLNTSELKNRAKMIGADCPFFIDNKPAFIEGLGDIIHPFNLDLRGLQLVLIKPPFGVPTPLAYKNIIPKEPQIRVTDIIKEGTKLWKENLKNDFETHIFKKYPEIERIKTRLYRSGAAYASMSGSGSTVFGLFSKQVNLETQFPNCFYFSCEL
jgi:4-diphosphocytidyl-2-C-methyl-D-erythritol kinase